ncbi:OmpA/MotB family protein [Hyalangium rubrum]|uniref:OmpA family protein n=1 Tax=Hyalangium rubrum TaxID=3103134 RepID=A0ABU5H0C8_9BACT|nr:OmpA family protein [Hyalangium sp. s54d21]MDY7226584.1 OmpA family protein [Hyalangium sp. s54d21]
MLRRRKEHEEGWLLSYADLITNLLLFFVLLLSAANLSKGRMQQIVKGMSGSESPASLDAIRREIDAQIAQKQMQDLVHTTVSDEGLELSLNSGLVFDPGKAQIRSQFEQTVTSMLQVLAPYSTKYSFAVEGHTDSTPIVSGGLFATNWELSSARAIVVRQRLEEVGISRSRIRVEGYADTKPLPEDQLTGLSPQERLARHRRVVVRIY